MCCVLQKCVAKLQTKCKAENVFVLLLPLSTQWLQQVKVLILMSKHSLLVCKQWVKSVSELCSRSRSRWVELYINTQGEFVLDCTFLFRH